MIARARDWNHRSRQTALACTLLFGPLCVPAFSAAPPEEIPVLVLELEFSGLPGQERKSEAMRHRLTIDAVSGRVRLEVLARDGAGTVPLSPEGANRIILRNDLEPPLIFEIIDRQKRYRIKSGDLNRLQSERDLHEAQIRKLARSLPAPEREKLLRDEGVRLDGERNVEVERGGTRKIKGYDCQQVIVTENGRRVIEAWITKDIGGGSRFYELYKRLGVFSDQVLEKVATLEGLPLDIKFKVITAAPSYDLEAKCLSVDPGRTMPSNAFNVPAAFQKVEEIPAVLRCPVCGKEVERDEPGAKWIVQGKTYLFDSRECRDKLRRDFLKRRKKSAEKE